MGWVPLIIWAVAVVCCVVDVSKHVAADRPLLPLGVALFIVGFGYQLIFPSTSVHHGG